MLIKLLYNSEAKVYISFDLWSSLNHFSMLGIIDYFINSEFKACTILFGIKCLLGLYSKENIFYLLIETVKTYKLAKVLEFCILDNAGDNNTSLWAVQAYLLTEGVL